MNQKMAGLNYSYDAIFFAITYLQMLNKAYVVRHATLKGFSVFTKIAYRRHTVALFRCDTKIIFKQNAIFRCIRLAIRFNRVDRVYLFIDIRATSCIGIYSKWIDMRAVIDFNAGEITKFQFWNFKHRYPSLGGFHA